MAWDESIIQNAKVKQYVILTGNVRDEFWNQEKDIYQLLPHYLHDRMESEGWSLVLQWDPITNLTFETLAEAQEYDRRLQNANENLNNDQYGNGDDEEDEYDVGGEMADEIAQEISLQRFIGLNDMLTNFSLICRDPLRPVALIINWGDYLIDAKSFRPEDRNLLLKLGETSVQSGLKEKIRTSDLNNPSSPIFIITANIAQIHHSFYEPDPRVSIVTIQKPGIVERRTFLNRHYDDFKISAGKGDKGRKDKKQVIEDLVAASDGLTTADLRMVLELSNQIGEDVDYQELINMYLFGKKESPWEDLDEDKLNRLKDDLNGRILGQGQAVDHVVTTIIKASTGLSGLQYSAKRTKPKGTLFFVGPTGVGKTEMAKGIAKFLFGDESAFIRFDMAEFKQDNSDQRLVGAPPGYVGFENGGQLTNAVIERPFSVLLFDEIEKAHERILDVFLGILEDGRLTDGRGETAYFSETIIIFTSNIGAADDKTTTYEDRKGHYNGAIKNHFYEVLKRPEILNRIGNNVVVFDQINNKEFQREILIKKLEPVIAFIKEKYGAQLSMADNAYQLIVNSADVGMGGRGILNVAERILIDPLSTFIFQNKRRLSDSITIRAKVESGERKIGFTLG